MSTQLYGKLTPINTLKCYLTMHGTLKAELTAQGTLRCQLHAMTTDVPPYTDEYVVTPRTYEQTLDTSQKLMIGDVIVESIPYSKVSNIHNGYTVTIGG